MARVGQHLGRWCIAFALSCLCGAQAADFPLKPVRIVVAVAAGSSGDVLGRLVADHLSTAWKQQVLIENRPGAGGVIAGQAVLAAPADGHTLFLASGASLVIAAFTQANMPYDAEKDFVPIAMVADIPLLIGVGPSLPVRSVQELIDFAAKNPGKVTYAGNTPGSILHLSTELLASRSNVRFTFVPYKGSAPALQDLMGGRLHMMVEGGAALFAAIRAGSVRPIAVTTPRRLSAFPDVPPVSDTLPGFSASGFYALVGPAKMPDAAVRKINSDVQQVLARADVAARFAEFGNYVLAMSPEELAAFIRRDRETWGPVIKRLGFTPQ